MNRPLAIPTSIDDVVTGVFLSASPEQVRAALVAAQIIIENPDTEGVYPSGSGSVSRVILNPAFNEFMKQPQAPARQNSRSGGPKGA